MPKRGDNIYKRKDGRYEGRYSKGRRDNGSIRYGCIYGYSLEEVREKLEAIKHSQTEDNTEGTVQQRLGEFLTSWLSETVRERVKPSTFSRYYDRVHNYIIPSIGDIALNELSKRDIQSFVSELLERKLSCSTAQSILVTLRKSLKDAAELELVSSDPCDGVIIPKEKGSEDAQVLSRSEQLQILLAAEQAGQSVELSVLLSLYAGLSTGEMCALHWRDVDFGTGTLVVGSVLQRVKVFGEGTAKSELIESPQKGSRARRRIPLPGGILEKLREYGENMPGGFFILSGSAKPVEPRRLRARLEKAETASGLKISFQALRRAYASQCIENSCGEETLSWMLGISSTYLSRRMQSYSALEQGRQIAERVWSGRFAQEDAEKFNIGADAKTSG